MSSVEEYNTVRLVTSNTNIPLGMIYSAIQEMLDNDIEIPISTDLGIIGSEASYTTNPNYLIGKVTGVSFDNIQIYLHIKLNDGINTSILENSISINGTLTNGKLNIINMIILTIDCKFGYLKYRDLGYLNLDNSNHSVYIKHLLKFKDTLEIIKRQGYIYLYSSNFVKGCIRVGEDKYLIGKITNAEITKDNKFRFKVFLFSSVDCETLLIVQLPNDEIGGYYLECKDDSELRDNSLYQILNSSDELEEAFKSIYGYHYAEMAKATTTKDIERVLVNEKVNDIKNKLDMINSLLDKDVSGIDIVEGLEALMEGVDIESTPKEEIAKILKDRINKLLEYKFGIENCSNCENLIVDRSIMGFEGKGFFCTSCKLNGAYFEDLIMDRRDDQYMNLNNDKFRESFRCDNYIRKGE